MVQPLFPRILEPQVSLHLVNRLEARRQPSLQWKLPKQRQGEAVERLDRGQLHFPGGALAALPFLRRSPLISGILFEFPAHSFPQFAGSGVGESDGGQAVHFSLARSDERGNSADQRRGLARAGAGLDKQVFIQAGPDAETLLLVDGFDWNSWFGGNNGVDGIDGFCGLDGLAHACTSPPPVSSLSPAAWANLT